MNNDSPTTRNTKHETRTSKKSKRTQFDRQNFTTHTRQIESLSLSLPPLNDLELFLQYKLIKKNKKNKKSTKHSRAGKRCGRL